MNIEHTSVDGVFVVSIAGSLDAPSAPQAEQTFTDLIQDGARKVLVDFSGMEYISSGGIRVVIMVHKALEKAGGALKLCSLSPFVADVFHTTHLAQVFDIHDDQENALATFGESP
jgi:anti-anti-sigma factor